MASSTLSLKSLRDTNTLKSEISKLETEKQDILAKLDREKKLVKKLQEDLLEQKKDFEHLEKQFDHFAGIEAEFDALQQEVQMERLENLLKQEKTEEQSSTAVKKAREEIKVLQQELKELKKLDPVRLKRQVVDLKKKNSTQASENKALNNALVAARKELKDTVTEKEKLDTELKAAFRQSNAFWQSDDGEWALYETGLLLKDESEPEDGENPVRIRCINLTSGSSALSRELIEDGKDKGKVVWFSELEIPEEVSIEAGKRLLNLAADLDDE